MFGNFRHICDGSWQCPSGDDETKCQEHRCRDLFKCISEAFPLCLHPVEVCNGVPDCVSGEDEYMCEMPKQCLPGCICLLQAVLCEKSEVLSSNISDFSQHYSYLKFINVTFPFMNTSLFEKSKHLTILVWIYSALNSVCNLFCVAMSSLHHLDFSSNDIEFLENNCFQFVPNVLILILKHNKLTKLTPLDLKELQILDLSHNRLTSFLTGIEDVTRICFLNVQSNDFKLISNDMFGKISHISETSADDFKICCFVNQVETGKCSSIEPKWPYSCQTTFVTPLLQALGITGVVILFLFNAVACVLVYIQKKKRRKSVSPGQNTAGSFLITVHLLHGNGVAFSLYLSVVLSAQKWVGEVSVLNLTEWITSIPCIAIGTLSTCIMINSYMLTNCLSVSRLLVVKCPFEQKFRRSKTTVSSLRISFIGTMLFCLCIALLLLSKDTKTPLPLCTFLGETEPSKVIKVCTLIVASIEQLSFVILVICYPVIFSEMKKSAAKTHRPFQGNRTKFMFFLLGTTHAICWLPSSATYIATIAMENYPFEIFVWNNIIVNQLCFMLHPIVYTIGPSVQKSLKGKRGKPQQN